MEGGEEEADHIEVGEDAPPLAEERREAGRST
jgi:hypothetical protein